MACKDKAPTSDSTTIAITKPKVWHETYAVQVDQLRLRSAPGKSSDVIEKLRLGTLVQSNGELSQQTDEVVLRGITYNTPYVKVDSPTQKDTSGWVYGGALLKVYRDTLAYPFSKNLDGLAKQMFQLAEVPTLDHMKTIVSLLSKENSSVPMWNDALLILGESTLQRMSFDPTIYQDIAKKLDANKYYEAVISRTIDYNTIPLGQDFIQAAMMLEAAEGSIFPMVDYSLLRKSISGPLTKSGEAYVQLCIDDQKQRLTSDATIHVPLRHIVDLYEKARLAHESAGEGSLFTEKILQIKNNYKRLLTHGTANMPLYENDGSLSSGYREGLSYLITTYPESDLVETAQNVLK